MSNEKNNINNTTGEPENNEKKETAKNPEKIEKKETAKKPEKKVDPKKAEKKAAKQARHSLKARAFKRGWFSIALVVLCIAAVIIVNMIASALVSRVPALNFDTTGEESFSLTDDTVDFVSQLEQDITIYVLASEKDYKDGGEYFIQANTLLHAYENASDKIKLQYVDLSTNPTFTEKYPEEDLNTYNIIVQGENSYKYLLETDLFEYDEEYLYYYGSYVVNGSNVEEAITSAILNVTLEDKPKVTFISDVTEEDYSAFKTLLDNNGFETAEVSPTVGTIPEDTSIVVLYAPTTDLDSEFVSSLNDFLLNNGNYGKQLLYFPTYKLMSLPNIDSLLEEWGLAVEQSYAVEQDPNYMANYYNYYVLFAAQYADTTYTANMSNSNLPVCFIQGSTRVVDILDSQSASALLTLTEQGQAAYADSTETADSPEAVYEDAPNAAVAAIATKSVVTASDTDTDSDSGATEEKKSNIIVIASSGAVSSSSLSRNTYGNSSYMLSLLNTVTGRGDVGIAIESKTMGGTELGITSSQLYALGTVFIAIIPVIILIAGIVVFVKRKNM